MELSEYYKNYLKLHKNKYCRRLHFTGQLLTILFVVMSILHEQWYMLLVAPFVIYPFAWTGHFFFERNKPAAWRDPIKAKICDWVMFKDILLRRIKW